MMYTDPKNTSVLNLTNWQQKVSREEKQR